MPTMMKNIPILLLLSLSLKVTAAVSEPEGSVPSEPSLKEFYESCLLATIKESSDDITFTEVETLCEQKVLRKTLNADTDESFEFGAATKRAIQERKTSANPYVITPHKMNYFLPLSMVNEINREVYSDISTWKDDLKNVETKFQISLKVPLLASHLFNDADQVFFAFTLQSWWQVYSNDISSPFRETNYQPELMYSTPISFHPFNGNSALAVGIEHQSNGRSQWISRSWNRIFVNYLYEKNNFALSFRPWYRLPEDEKLSPTDARGDDNPDILDYMGHFELKMFYKFTDDLELSFKGRNNFATHKGFIEVGATFPLWGKLKGYAQYSSGYGESLIDYNVNQKRFGIGIALTNIL